MVDTGAPYAARGFSGICPISPSIIPTCTSYLGPIPAPFVSCSLCQYATAEHASHARRMLASVLLLAISPTGVTLHIHHLVLEGSRQWVCGRSLKSKSNVHVVDDRPIELRGTLKSRVILPLIEANYLRYLLFCLFDCSVNAIRISSSPFLHTMAETTPSTDGSWYATRSIIDREDRYNCGHASFSDMRLFL